MTKMTNQTLRLCVLALTSASLAMAGQDCAEKIEDTEWCDNGIKLESYRFPPREFQMELSLNSDPFPLRGLKQFQFVATVNWHNVEIKVDKKISQEEVTLAGYFYKRYDPFWEPDYEKPDLVIIFVKNRERKRQIENDIAIAQKKFAENCFGCKQLGIKDPGPGSSKKKIK